MTQQEYQRRRQALLAQMQPGSAALIFAAPEARATQTVNIRIARVATSGISPVLTNRKPCWY